MAINLKDSSLIQFGKKDILNILQSSKIFQNGSMTTQN